MQMQYTVYLSYQPSSHEILACLDNTAKFFWPIGDHINGVPPYTFMYTVG